MIRSLILAVALSGSPKDLANRPVKHVVAPKAVALTMPALPAVVVASNRVGSFYFTSYVISPDGDMCRTNSPIYVTVTNGASFVIDPATTNCDGVQLTTNNVLSYGVLWTTDTNISWIGTNVGLSTNIHLSLQSDGTLILTQPVTTYRAFYFQSSPDMVSWSDVLPQPVKVITNRLGTLPQEFYRMRVQTSTNVP